MHVLFRGLTVVLVLSLVGCGSSGRTRAFRKAIAGADEIVVRGAGFDCCGTVDNAVVFHRITDPATIRLVRTNLRFEPKSTGSCMCCGYPGIDWYKKGKRIALTGLQHGRAMRWKGWQGDSTLTLESRDWLSRWLAELRVPSELAYEKNAW